MKYSEWETEAMHEAHKGVLMTISHITSRRNKDDMDYYTSSQLDNLKDCMCILHKMHELHHMHHENGNGVRKPVAVV